VPVLALIAEPAFAPSDRAWIDRLRRAHDPEAGHVPPHVTLIFPTDQPAVAPLRTHIRRIVRKMPAIRTVFRVAVVLPGPDGHGHYAALAPEQGFAALVRLHDRLYGGPFAGALRHDIAYLPHLTVGRFDAAVAARRLVDRLNRRAFALNSAIRALDLLQLERGQIIDRQRLQLAL